VLVIAEIEPCTSAAATAVQSESFGDSSIDTRYDPSVTVPVRTDSIAVLKNWLLLFRSTVRPLVVVFVAIVAGARPDRERLDV
jgi:hypothetical protein